MNRAALLLFEQAFGLPTGEALVHHFDRQAELLVDTLTKTGRFFGHVASRAVEAEGKADDDLPDRVFTDKFAEAAHVFVAVDAGHGGEWTGLRVARLGDGDADADSAVIQRKDSRRPRTIRVGRG